MKCLFFDSPINDKVNSPGQKELNQILREVGGNTGNMLFRHAIDKYIEDKLIPTHWMDGFNLSKSEKFDAVVLGAANWLHSSQTFGNDKRAEILRKLNMPVLCVGLGCQNPVTTFEKIEFPKETVEFLGVLKSLNATVLTRDEMTRVQCSHYGIKNAVVTGCPSNFICCDGGLKRQLSDKFARTNFDRITINAGHLYGDAIKLDRNILRFTNGRAQSYVIQDNQHSLMAISLNREADIVPNHRRYLKKAFDLKRFPFYHKRNYESWKNQLVTFLDVHAWMAAASSWDLAIGTRIHGAMAALQSGTPAILITIDSRTAGLADTMGIPSIRMDRISEGIETMTLSDILDLAHIDVDEYFNKRKLLGNLYIEQLRNFGLTTSTSFNTIIGEQQS